MFSLRRTITASAILAVAHGQGVLLQAQGSNNAPASLGLQVNSNDTSDANFISTAEITANVVNECGRTLQAGNIDIGANTEDAIANNQITSVTQGSDVAVTMSQVNAAGAGPYTCDMDQTSNTLGADGQTKLAVNEADPDNNGNIKLTVTMPANMTCTGASTGNICTIRCFNDNSFGGCFSVQQTDTTPGQNSANTITTAAKLDAILSQVQQDKVDLPAAIQGIATSGPSEADKGVSVVESIQAADPATNALDESLLADNTGNATNANAGTANAGTANAGNGNAGNGKAGKGKAGKANAGNANNGNANANNANAGNGNANNANAGNANNGNANNANAGNGNNGNNNGNRFGGFGKGNNNKRLRWVQRI
ncbi:Uu.00g146520.m01.CDS01 [Anthostomella pinea]|uniref:Uu.00g146520.m01.CDS01 n=1 Tax=Anthostomella pinea TaxID=933095 RepID=A0AAI8VR74_9PEZI|nr:Uu.00g146520.m01.CDS01 [Anthostomella pinea]